MGTLFALLNNQNVAVSEYNAVKQRTASRWTDVILTMQKVRRSSKAFFPSFLFLFFLHLHFVAAHQFTMPDVEAPATVYVNANEKGKGDSSSSNGNWSYKAGGLQDPADLVQRRLKQRHIQM